MVTKPAHGVDAHEHAAVDDGLGRPGEHGQSQGGGEHGDPQPGRAPGAGPPAGRRPVAPRRPSPPGDPVRAWTAVRVQGSQAAPAMRSMCTIWADMYPAKAKVAAPNRAPVDEIDCRRRNRYIPARATS